MFININRLLKEKSPSKNGFDFISITKTITDQNMGSDNRFSETEVQEIKALPFVTDAAPLASNQFRAKASAGSVIPFSTDLFLESIKNDFLDTVPPSFQWSPGQPDVPIIFSADFLEMYNVFAPAQDLPQLSAGSISSINIILECYGPMGVQNFRGRIVAVSDRINSVLVPETFLTWANKNYGNATLVPPSRIYLKTPDANSAELQNFLQKKNYHINKDKTKFGRVKQVLQAVVGALGGFAILVILLALMLFSFYLQLMITKSKSNLQLLLSLGYSPGWLSKTMARQWLPVYAFIILAALGLTAVFQYFFTTLVFNNAHELSPLISPVVIVLALFLILLCVVVNYSLIKKMFEKL
jgi:ABC-type antimicrobial peptide transport system permease subunit